MHQRRPVHSSGPRVCAQLGDRAWTPRQTENAANPDAHYCSTGPEIWQDIDGCVDVLVAGVGRGGTIADRTFGVAGDGADDGPLRNQVT